MLIVIYCSICYLPYFFFSKYHATTEIDTYLHTLSLHAALPICYLRVRYCSWPTRAIFVSQSFNASLHEPAASFANRVLVNAQAFGDFLALQPFCTKQDHPASIRE